MLTEKEKLRYDRHLILEGFGEEAQLKLKSAKVLVVGAGGLGSPLLSYLCAVGVGNIGIVDFDRVDSSNLQRQTLYTTEDVGNLKTESAVTHLRAQNPHVNFEVFDTSIQAENIFDIIAPYEIVVDGTDNFPTRYLINDACVLRGKVNVHASINEFTGQLSVFNYLKPTGERSANYRDIYPQPPLASEVKNCSEAGVIGVLPGILGSMQALEVIKVITGLGEVLHDKMMFYNGLTQETFKLSFSKDVNNPLTREKDKQTTLIDYHEFCGVVKQSSMKSINVKELKQWQEANENFTLIDVREQYEFDQANMGAQLIPMNEVPNHVGDFKKEGKVVVHCRSGARSANVIAYLEQNHGIDNLYNLEGGIMAWLDAQ